MRSLISGAVTALGCIFLGLLVVSPFIMGSHYSEMETRETEKLLQEAKMIYWRLEFEIWKTEWKLKRLKGEDFISRGLKILIEWDQQRLSELIRVEEAHPESRLIPIEPVPDE